MKPLKLSVEAFGAYVKPVTLDFEKNLHDKKIFLINGTTGSGKTTILDAICFALYGTASGKERDAAMMRSKGISDAVNTKVEFTFSLGEKTYTVRRVLSYHPNRKTGKNQITAALTCKDEILASNSTGVTNKIESLLGFNAEQFRQVVLLPQGEFKNFLSADAKERQPVLDALFNARFYKLIEDELKNKSDAAQKVFDDLNSDRNALTAQFDGSKFDDDALKKLCEEFAAAQKKSAELKKIFDESQRRYTEGEILAGDFAELERRNQNLAAAKNDLAQAEKIFVDAKTEYELREGEQSQRDTLKAKVDELDKVKKSFDELDAKQKSFAEAEKIFQSTRDALKNFDDNAKKFEARLNQLKRQRIELSGAEKAAAEAKTILDRSIEREKILKGISKLKRELSAVEQQILSAEKLFNDAEIEYKRLEKLRRDGSAAMLSKNLRDGEPCPVCGSKVHYQVDFSDALIPSDKELEEAHAKVELCRKTLNGKKNSAASIEGQLLSQRDTLKNFADVPEKSVAQKEFDVAKKNAADLADCEKRIAKGEDCIKQNNSDLEKARTEQIAAQNSQAEISGAMKTLTAQIPEQYRDNRQQLDADLAAIQKTLRELESARKLADKNFRKAVSEKSSCAGKLTAAQNAQNELADKLKNKKLPDVDALKNLAEESRTNYDSAIRDETSLKNKLDTFKNLSAKLAELDKKISAAEKNFSLWKKLSDAASGKIRGNKLSFARYYLSAMFDQVLTEANYRLDKMTNRRYSLQSKYAGKRSDSTAGLNLEIFDEYTGEARPVATLSGGESFLASLSLALGLASVVRNNLGGIKLDTIFIDEGFGSLDSETLDFAISTIIEQSGGRLVGIISHVEELKNQMPVRLEVTKTETGSTAKFIS